MVGAANPFGFVERKALMAYWVAHFDESGKFKDHDIISFAGFLADEQAWGNFSAEWNRLLRLHGLDYLHSVKAFHFAGPLSSKFPARGVDARRLVLNKYVAVIKKHVEFGVACAVDAAAFRSLTTEQQRKLRNPHYAAFLCVIGELKDYVQDDDKISLMCDDEQQYSVECYKLFTSIRKQDREMRHKFISIGFGDDRHFPQIQAADLFAGLLRHEAEMRFLGKAYQFRDVFGELMRTGEATPQISIKGYFYRADELRKLGA
jgi:hypothetical protein